VSLCFHRIHLSADGYTDIVPHPIDLGTIHQKLQAAAASAAAAASGAGGPGYGYKCLGEVREDFQRLHDNCELYNQPGTVICQHSEMVRDEGTQVVVQAEDIQDEEEDQKEEREELKQLGADGDDKKGADSAADSAGGGAGGAVEEANKKKMTTKKEVPWEQRWRVRVKYDAPIDGGATMDAEIWLVGEARSRIWVPPTGASSKELLCTGPYKFDVVVTSYETLTSQGGSELRTVPWSMVVVDEAHRLKNATAKIYTTLMQEVDFANCLLLTGTWDSLTRAHALSSP
jgi:hypothetical protein